MVKVMGIKNLEEILGNLADKEQLKKVPTKETAKKMLRELSKLDTSLDNGGINIIYNTENKNYKIVEGKGKYSLKENEVFIGNSISLNVFNYKVKTEGVTKVDSLFYGTVKSQFTNNSLQKQQILKLTGKLTTNGTNNKGAYVTSNNLIRIVTGNESYFSLKFEGGEEVLYFKTPNGYFTKEIVLSQFIDTFYITYKPTSTILPVQMTDIEDMKKYNEDLTMYLTLVKHLKN